MVDIDPAELEKWAAPFSSHLRGCGDFNNAMLQKATENKKKDRSAWKQRCATWRERYPLVLPIHKDPDSRVSAYNFAEVMSSELDEGDFIVSGSSGTGIELFLLAFRTKRGQRIFHTTALGAMGFGIPAALGAGIACVPTGSKRRIVCVDGDGGFQFNIQELETVARPNLPIKFFVQQLTKATDPFALPRLLLALAKSDATPLPARLFPMSAAWRRPTASPPITCQRNLGEEIRRVLAAPGPVVCDVQIALDEIRQPRLSSVQLADGSFVSSRLKILVVPRSAGVQREHADSNAPRLGEHSWLAWPRCRAGWCLRRAVIFNRSRVSDGKMNSRWPPPPD
jgi:acetolactate synthase-1/2/3 large subunit